MKIHLSEVRWLLISIALQVLFFGILTDTQNAHAQNEVVVIPIFKQRTPSPFAPVTADSPPNSAYFIKDEVVVDNVTGLMWQKKIEHELRTWNEAWNYCYNLSLWTGISPKIGITKTDWRLPSIDELISITDYFISAPSINNAFYKTPWDEPWWSATNSASHYNDAWYIEFFDGRIATHSRLESQYVRCVRGLSNRQSLLTDNGNGTVTDLATGLTWQRQDYSTIRVWDKAVLYCEEQSLAGGGWRLPTVKELRSIIDDRIKHPAFDEDVFPIEGKTGVSWPYWSVTEYTAGSYAWYADLYSGKVLAKNKASNLYVRCVR